jgi:glycosyltransferase involved in cell wall biosynthesis
MGLLFYPRGGSAQVARYLSAALVGAGWEVDLVAGSLGAPGAATHAATFFAGLPVHPVDYTAAAEAHARGGDALAAPVPMHPSYEDRPGVPDRFLAAVDPALAEHLGAAWERVLPREVIDRADVFHLHHLTPIHEAVARLRPDAPVVAHLHGTELKMLEAIAHRAGLAAALGTDLAGMAAAADAGVPPPAEGLDEGQRRLLHATRWQQWRHGSFWAGRLRAVAARCDRLVVISPSDRNAAAELLGADPAVVEWIPNGVDTARFRPRALAPDQRLALLRRWLVDDPQGWDDSGVPGSIRYREADLERFVDGATGRLHPLLFYVGRFTAVKRIPLLLRAYARARLRFAVPAPLVVWGGHPGELEGEHPVAVATRLGLEDVAFVGWRGHGDLPLGLACADLLVLPSVNESFGQTALEAMVCGVPVVATRSGGPPSFINTDPARPTGWLVGPDDEDQLADALVEAVNRPDERRRRGRRSLATATARFSWPALVPRFEAIYGEVGVGVRPAGAAPSARCSTPPPHSA